jgi:hypothetical protein
MGRDVRVLPRACASRFAAPYAMLESITIRLLTEKGGTSRRGFGTHRAVTFGMVRTRSGTDVALSKASRRFPDMYEALFALGDELAPDFDFTSVHVNKNVVCPPHKDSNNVGPSMLVSFGPYTGCEVVVEGTQYDTRHTPHIFDGSALEHWNVPTLQGTKYSLVYYTAPTPTPTVARAPSASKKVGRDGEKRK